MAYTVLLVIVGLLVLEVLYEWYRDRKLPPGPRRIPFIGNLHQAPQVLPWRTYHEWAKQWGPIFSVQYGKDTLIFIADHTIARELLDKRGAIYSDRPRMVMAGENLTKGMHQLIRPYNESHRLHQRLEAPVISPRASNTYAPLQDLESKQTIVEFLTSNDYRKRFERYSASLVYALAYGIRVPLGTEQHLLDAHKVQDNFTYAGRVGTWIVDSLPFLNILPKGPLAPWKVTADAFFELESTLHLSNMAIGQQSAHWNWTREFQHAREAQQMGRLELAYDLGILVDAGLDTTSIAMEVFMLACLAQPHWIPRAQQELDRVVGPDRLPTFADKPALPYIVGVVEEVLRWRPVGPQGVPHATTREDWWGGYRIPKGAIVTPLVWSMNLDPATYPDPDCFRPDRWLEMPEEKIDNRITTFGFGRRVCTGRHIARNSVFLLVARMLWAFDITHALDECGNRKEVDPLNFTSGFASKPEPFECVVTPRSDRHREVVEREWRDQEKDVGKVLDAIRDEMKRVGLDPKA